MSIVWGFTFGILFIPFLIIFRISSAITDWFLFSVLLGLAPYVYGGIYLYNNFHLYF